MPVRSRGPTLRVEGVRDLVIAWTLGGGEGWLVRWTLREEGGVYPWKVPARTRRSLTESLLRGELKSRLKTRPPALFMMIME